MSDLVSVIIRTKDEERWIIPCLQSVFAQSYKNYEVIIVDNESSDRTIEKARQFEIKKIVSCKDYLPGKALNMGIREATGKYIVCLSGHCIPVNDRWLENLLNNFNDSRVAGVYGRQEPMASTSDADKRDLAIIFGLDRKVQVKDSFFHNANSMIRQDLWKEVPFDKNISNIEDRIWAQQMLRKGYKIIYEPEASVYHWHGIHQEGNPERCYNIVRILENMDIINNSGFAPFSLDGLKIVALIPVKGPVKYLASKPLIAYTIEAAKQSRYITDIIVSTDNEDMAQVSIDLGAQVPFIRDTSFSRDFIDLETVLRYSLEKIEEQHIYPDLLVAMETTFPFKPKKIIDRILIQLVKNGLDSVLAARRENKSIWKMKDGIINRIDEGLTPRKFKDSTFIGLRGICCAAHPAILRSEGLYGNKIGIYEVENPYSWIEVRSDEDFVLAEQIMKTWKKNQ